MAECGGGGDPWALLSILVRLEEEALELEATYLRGLGGAGVGADQDCAAMLEVGLRRARALVVVCRTHRLELEASLRDLEEL